MSAFSIIVSTRLVISCVVNLFKLAFPYLKSMGLEAVKWRDCRGGPSMG